MLGYVSEIRREVSNHVQHYLRFNTRATRNTTLPSEYYIIKYLHDIVVPFVAYDVIEEQLRIDNVYVISSIELQNHMNTLLATFQGNEIIQEIRTEHHAG